MYDAQHSNEAQHSSPTAIACEQAELFGATPGPDEPTTAICGTRTTR